MVSRFATAEVGAWSRWASRQAVPFRGWSNLKSRMGLDAVEIVLRVEEFYSLAVADDEAARVRTVGDLYELICLKLGVAPLARPRTSVALPKVSVVDSRFLFLETRTPLHPSAEVLPWTPQSVWDTYVALLVDQQGLRPEEILAAARFVEDLGVC